MKAKLIICHVPSDNLQASLAFYAALFGGPEMARSLTDQMEGHHLPISNDGIDLQVNARSAPQDVACNYYRVADIAATLQALQAAGGTVVVQPSPIPIGAAATSGHQARVNTKRPAMAVTETMGQHALVVDPSGNLLGVGPAGAARARALQGGPARGPRPGRRRRARTGRGGRQADVVGGSQPVGVRGDGVGEPRRPH